MALLDIYSLNKISLRSSIDEILETNELSAPFGVSLSFRDAYQLIESRNLAVHNYGRVEFDIGVLKSIITHFCNSPYINNHDYLSTITELMDIFYFMKNETEDRVGDNQLIELMKYYFNNSCCGSTDLLRNRELALIARILKKSWEKAKEDD